MRKSRLLLSFSGFLLLSATLIGHTATLQAAIASQEGSTKALLISQNDAYAPVRSALNAKNWQAADRETRRLLERWVHPNGDLFSSPLANNIPADVLQTLDRLWLEASNGRFGFSVQQRIWREVAAQHRNDNAAAVRAFGRRVGWLRPAPDNNNFVSPEWLTEPELSNSSNAPVGMFPWVGVSWERIQAMLNQQSCGSCMVDAMYLQGDRFYRYIPALYNRTQVALGTPTQPGSQSWRNPRQRFQIDLNSLYPSNSCPVATVAQTISPNGQILAVSTYSYERACGGSAPNSTLTLWNAQRGNRIITLTRGLATESFGYGGRPQEPPTEQDRMVGEVANAIAFTPNSQQIAAGMSDGTVRVWSTTTGQLQRTLTGHRYAVRAIAMSQDGTRLVSASSDQTIRLWNLQTGQLLRTIPLNEADGVVQRVKLSPDGTRLAIATNRNKLQLRNLSNGQVIRSFVDGSGSRSEPMPIVFSPDGRFVATSDSDNSVKVWNASTGARLVTFAGHSAAVMDIAFSPDNQMLASSSSDFSVRLWNLRTNQLQHTLNAAAGVSGERPQSPGSLAFTADGRTLASSALLPIAHPISGEPLAVPGLRLWEVSSGQPIGQVQYVNRFSFSPDGQFLLTNGQTLQVWQP